jgi:hypothetical protein
MRTIGRCIGYFLAGFFLFALVGWWKGHHVATSSLTDSQVKRVIFENLELRRVNSSNNFFLRYTCDSKPIYAIDLDTHQLTTFEKISSSDSVFKPALIIPASEVGLWALGGASGFTLIEKGKLLFSESAAESPSWRTVSFVAGAITGYLAGLLGERLPSPEQSRRQLSTKSLVRAPDLGGFECNGLFSTVMRIAVESRT